jgi:hypothetical protein
MSTPVRRLRRDAGTTMIGYLVLIAALSVAVTYFASMSSSINNTTKSAAGFQTVGGACSQTDSTAGVFARVAHAANCK